MLSDSGNNVVDAFGVLLDEIEVQIGWTDKAGAQAFEQHNYDQARQVLERAKQLSVFRDRVVALRSEWEKTFGSPVATPAEKTAATAGPVHPAEAFRAACLARVEKQLKVKLTRKSATSYVTADGKVAVICAVSSEYTHTTPPRYWFAFHPYQAEFLEPVAKSYLALGCGSADRVLLIPFQILRQWLNSLNTTDRKGDVYWHIHVLKRGDHLTLNRKKGFEDVDLTEYLLR